MDKKELCSFIDHTNLKSDAQWEDIERLCQEAVDYQFKAVCINPVFVDKAAAALNKSGVRVCTVVGFPLGASTTSVKVSETSEAVRNGAEEIDMVINIGALKAGDDFYVVNEIRKVVEAAQPALVKVIIEICLLSDQEKVQACRLVAAGGADFVKTSTGFSSGGATVEDVLLMKKVIGDQLGVKAAGGIRNINTFMAMIKAGADRIGTSSGVRILSELK